jgi:hypothetical protein
VTEPQDETEQGRLTETTMPSRIGAGGTFGETESERKAMEQSARSDDPTMGQPSAEELLNPPPGKGAGTPQDNQGAARGM